MKQILKLGILALAGFIVFNSSCTKDVFTEEDAFANQEDLELLKDSLATAQALLRDSLQKAGGIIDYSVGVALGSDASWFSYFDKGGKGGQGLDGVTVTIAQYGKIQTVTTNASGIASFKDLRIGTVNVNVKKTGYTEVDFVALLPALLDTVYVEAYNLVRHVSTLVPVFSLTTNLSTISGVATIETDLTNNAPEPAAGVKIAAVIDVSDMSFIGTYLQWWPDVSYDCDCEWWNFDYYGIIKQIAYHSTISEATTAADGSFTLQVPSSGDGLPIQLIPSEYAANQSLLQATLNNVPVWGVQTVRTLFGPDYTYSDIPTNGTEADQVQSAYVTFSAPTGTPAAQPTTKATATAVLASSGIASINMISQGSGYTQVPRVVIELGTAFNSVQAEGTAVMSGGKITGVTITSAGSGYKPGDTPTIAFEETVERTASADAEFSFSVVDVEMSDDGSGYTSTAPNVTIIGSGTGATAHAIMTAWPTDINMTAMGSNYTADPLVRISDNFGAEYDLTPVMTEYNPLYSITYDGTNTTNLWPASPLPTATIVGDGAGATANVTLKTAGQVTGYTALTGGSGYSAVTPPVVTISGGGGFGATATATVAAGAVTDIDIIDGGQGYTSVPSFTFTGGGGAGANATPTLGFEVASITMSAAGVGYSGVTQINLNNGGGPVDYSGYCQVKYNQGVRDITLAGTGYYFSAVPTVTITPKDGNGTGAAATAVITWGIKDIELDNQGSGYKDDNANNVTVRIDPPAGNGTQALATAYLGNGVLSRVELNEYGQGYTAAPNVYMVNDEGTVPTKQAEMTATVSGGQVTGITITDPGAGYDFDDYVAGDYYIEISTYDGAAGATAKVNPKSGTIDYIQIDDPGAGYAVVPKVEITNATADPANANGFGTGAAATATITDGRVSAITLTNAGSGYYFTPTVNITVPWSSMTAVGQCTVDPDGRITAVTFPASYPYTQGYGYDAPPTVTFTASIPGKGSSAAGTAVVADGRITSVIMTNQGSGYIGKNNPNTSKAFGFLPTSTSLQARAGKAYVRDLFLGTGKRTIEQ
jgi:hypothetical protein